jgi:Tol biopolymer transport system component
MKLAFTAVHEANGAELHVLDFEEGTDEVLDIDLTTMTRPRFTADGDTIVFSGAESTGDKSALYRADASDGDAEAITEPEEGDGGHDIAPDGTIYFVRKLSNNTFDVFSIDVSDSPSDDPVRITTGSTIIGGVAVHPAGTHIMYAKTAGGSTQLVERALSGGTERNIGEQGDEQPAYFAGADGLVVNRDSFDTDSEIAITDEDGVLSVRLTDSDPFDTAPAVSPIDSEDVDVDQF